MIVSKAPEIIMDLIKKEYHIKGEGAPEYYPENNYKTYKGRYAARFKKYIKEAVRIVQNKEKRNMKQQSVLASPGNHPEL